MTCSSAAQIVTIYDQYGVPIKIQTISDSFVQNGTMIQSKPNIIAPATRTELHVTNPDLHDRQQIIRYTWHTTSLTLSQGDIRLFTWKGQSEAVTGYYTHWEFNCSFMEAKPIVQVRLMPDLSSTNVPHLRRKHGHQDLRGTYKEFCSRALKVAPEVE